MNNILRSALIFLVLTVALPASVLSAEERRSLMLAMARDVLTALSRSSKLTGILLVSRTAEADDIETFRAA